MPGLGDVIGEGSTARQLFEWQVLGAVVSIFFAPYLQQVTSDVWTRHPVMPLSAAEVAAALNRAFMTEDDAAKEAAKGGIDAARLKVLQDLAGDAPSPTDLVTALRRKIIDRHGTGADSTSFDQGIREGNLHDKWTSVVAQLAVQWPTPLTAVDATLKGQVTPEQGKALYEQFGGDPQWFPLLHDTAGSAPTPLEAVDMALRGIIPWTGRGPDVTSYEQAFLEGPWRDKWQPAYEKAALYHPTVSESLELYKYGKQPLDVTTRQLTERGLTADQAAAWIGVADATSITDYRGLTESAVLGMLAVGYITDAQARTMLEGLHKGAAAIDTLIAYAHIQKTITSLSRAVDRIGTLYQDRKITQDTARQSLLSLHIPPAAIGGIIEDWAAVAAVNVKTLTESQVTDAVKYGIISTGEALTELENIGYTPRDAWILLSVKAKQPLPGEPPGGPAAPIGTVTPGTT